MSDCCVLGSMCRIIEADGKVECLENTQVKLFVEEPHHPYGSGVVADLSSAR